MRSWPFLILLVHTLLLAQKPTVEKWTTQFKNTPPDTAQVTRLNKISTQHAQTDSTRSLWYAFEALRMAQSLQWNEGIARSYFRIGSQYYSQHQYDRAILHFDKALGATKDPKLQSKIYSGIGNCHFYESDYSKALAFYHRALKIDEARRDREGIGKTTLNIASVYYSLEDYPKSIAFFNRALDQKIADPGFNAALLRNLGAAHNTMGHWEKALVYFERSLAMWRDIGDPVAQASLLSDIALVYYDTEDYGKAIRYSKAALALEPDASDKVNRAFTYGVIGDSYTEKAKQTTSGGVLLDSAVHYLNLSIQLHKDLQSVRGLYDDYTSLTAAQKLSGDYRAAMASYEQSIVYKDSLFNADNRETIKNIEDKRAIELRDKELKINKLQLEANHRQKWALSLGVIFLGVIGGLLYYQSAARKETNRQLHAMNADLDRANNVKTRLLSILNHDLRSPVNSFIHYIQFKKENPELLDPAAEKRIEQATLASAKNLLLSMEDMLLWTKDHMEHFEPRPSTFRVQAVFDAMRKHFSTVTEKTLLFEADLDFDIVTDENYLKTVVRNLTANAIQATKDQADAQIVWRGWQKDGRALLSITDNGPGMPKEQLDKLFDAQGVGSVQSGLGLHLVRDFTQAIGWKIDARSDASGTTFTLSEA